MKRVLLMTVVGALCWSPSALAGGPFVNTLNAPPGEIHAGQAWTAKLRAVNCFGSPAKTGMQPWIEIANADTGERVRFKGQPTKRRNAYETDYEARVVFPSAGRWTYTVGDRGSRYNRFGPVAVAARGGNAPVRELSAVGAAFALLAAAGFVARRRVR